MPRLIWEKSTRYAEEPQPLLCGGEQRIGASAAGNEPQQGRPGALSHGTGLCAGGVFNHAQSRFCTGGRHVSLF
jgi:hypothetical protein